MKLSVAGILLFWLIAIACAHEERNSKAEFSSVDSSMRDIMVADSAEPGMVGKDAGSLGAITFDSLSGRSALIADTLIISTKAAVFYQPDSIQMEKRMKQVGEADFRAGADDYIYYINISAEYLEKQGLRVLDAKNRKYLKFVSNDGHATVIKLDTLQELWGMYLFDPVKKPQAVDITMIEEEYGEYFR